MFLTTFWTEVIVVGAVVALFIIISYLNVKTKAPKDAKLPEQCQFCPSKTCIIKANEINKKSEELREYLDKCEQNNNETD